MASASCTNGATRSLEFHLDASRPHDIRSGRGFLSLSPYRGGTIVSWGMLVDPGAGVVTTRGHVHWVATEYGAVNLHGKTLRERGEALIAIAHPDFRAELARDLAGIRHFQVRLPAGQP